MVLPKTFCFFFLAARYAETFSFLSSYFHVPELRAGCTTGPITSSEVNPFSFLPSPQGKQSLLLYRIPLQEGMKNSVTVATHLREVNRIPSLDSNYVVLSFFQLSENMHSQDQLLRGLLLPQKNEKKLFKVSDFQKLLKNKSTSSFSNRKKNFVQKRKFSCVKMCIYRNWFTHI